MAITYTWTIQSLKTKTEGANQGSVVNVVWKKTGTDENGNTGDFTGATPFTSSNMTEGNIFIPFAELTEEIVLNWVKGVVINEYEVHINEIIRKVLDGKVNQLTDAVMPWAPIIPAPLPPL